MEEIMIQFIHNSKARYKNQEASIHNLENQIGQLAKMLAKRQPGSLPSNTEENLKEQANAISLKSGKEIQLRKRKEPEGEQLQDTEERKMQKERKHHSDVKACTPTIPYPTRLK